MSPLALFNRQPRRTSMTIKQKTGILAIFLILAVSFSTNSFARSSLRLGYLPIAECTPLFVAQTEGFFQKHGLTVKLTEFDAGPTVIAATLGGSLDGGLAGVAPIFFAAAKEKPIKMVSDGGHAVPAEHPYVGMVVMVNSPIKSVAELKGKTVAVNGLKTIEDALLRVALNEAKISDSVKVIELPHPIMLPTLERGTIDASMAIEPYISMGLATGNIRVLAGSEDIIPSFQISTIFFSNEFIDRKPDTLKRFTAAYNDAIDFIAANPDRVRQIVAQWTKTPMETVKSITLPGWSKELPVAGIKSAQKVMVDNKILDKSVDLESYIYTTAQHHRIDAAK